MIKLLKNKNDKHRSQDHGYLVGSGRNQKIDLLLCCSGLLVFPFVPELLSKNTEICFTSVEALMIDTKFWRGSFLKWCGLPVLQWPLGRRKWCGWACERRGPGGGMRLVVPTAPSWEFRIHGFKLWVATLTSAEWIAGLKGNFLN